MEVPLNARFDEQCREFGFCFTCEHCAHFDADRGVCLHGFPNMMHRLGYYREEPRPSTIVFCKDFDLR